MKNEERKSNVTQMQAERFIYDIFNKELKSRPRFIKHTDEIDHERLGGYRFEEWTITINFDDYLTLGDMVDALMYEIMKKEMTIPYVNSYSELGHYTMYEISDWYFRQNIEEALANNSMGLISDGKITIVKYAVILKDPEGGI